MKILVTSKHFLNDIPLNIFWMIFQLKLIDWVLLKPNVVTYFFQLQLFCFWQRQKPWIEIYDGVFLIINWFSIKETEINIGMICGDEASRFCRCSFSSRCRQHHGGNELSWVELLSTINFLLLFWSEHCCSWKKIAPLRRKSISSKCLRDSFIFHHSQISHKHQRQSA